MNELMTARAGASPDNLHAELRALIAASRQRLAGAVNAELTRLYRTVEQRLASEVLGGERAQYGGQTMVRLGQRLAEEFGRGFEAKNLRRMVQFVQAFADPEKVASLMRQLSWTHFLQLIPVKTEAARWFYAHQCVERAEDVLWNSTGIGTFGRAHLVREADCIPQKVVDSHVTIVHHIPKIDPRYLFNWIKSPAVQDKIEEMCNGTTNQVELTRTATSVSGGRSTTSKTAKVQKSSLVEAGIAKPIVGDQSFGELLPLLPPRLSELMTSLEGHVLSLGDDVQRKELKLYVAFTRLKNFATVVPQKARLLLYLHVDPDQVLPLPSNGRNVRHQGHWGTGDLELSLASKSDLDAAKPPILLAYEGRAMAAATSSGP